MKTLREFAIVGLVVGFVYVYIALEINKTDRLLSRVSKEKTETLRWLKFFEEMAQDARETGNKPLIATCEDYANMYKRLAEMEKNNGIQNRI